MITRKLDKPVFTSFDITPSVQFKNTKNTKSTKSTKDIKNLSFADLLASAFKGLLHGFAFHTWPVVNSNHWAFWLDTVKRSIDTFVDTPINLHHFDSIIAGTINEVTFDANAGLEDGTPISIKGVLWKDLSTTRTFLPKVIKSIQKGEKKFKLSVELVYNSFEFFVYGDNSKPELVQDDNEYEYYMSLWPSDVGTTVKQGKHAGKTLGLLLGGRDDTVEFRGVAITIEDLDNAADQDAIIHAVATQTPQAIQVASNNSSEIINNGTKSIEEENSMLEKIPVRGTEQTKLVNTEQVPVGIVPEQTNSLEFTALSSKLDNIAAQLAAFVSAVNQPATSTEVQNVSSEEDKAKLAMQTELVSYRVAKLTTLFGPKLTEDATTKERLLNTCASYSKEDFDAYCADLQLVRDSAISANAQTEQLTSKPLPVALANKINNTVRENFVKSGITPETFSFVVPDVTTQNGGKN